MKFSIGNRRLNLVRAVSTSAYQQTHRDANLQLVAQPRWTVVKIQSDYMDRCVIDESNNGRARLFKIDAGARANRSRNQRRMGKIFSPGWVWLKLVGELFAVVGGERGSIRRDLNI